SDLLQGGAADNFASGIAVDSSGNFYVAGITSSTNFPTANAFRSTNSGSYDSFVAKFASPPDMSVAMFPSIEPVPVTSNVTYTIQINNNGRSTFSLVTNIVQLSSSLKFLSLSNTIGTVATNYSTNGTRLTFSIGTLSTNAAIVQTISTTATNARFATSKATLTGISGA